jgi:diguanylate cyclase (GGDEF)-like protein
MLDIDNFKQVNDQFSHLVGDEVLRTLARLLRDGCRSVDVVGRYGGEEFMLILVETGLGPAREVCEKLRQTIEAHTWEKIQPGLAQVTISIGLTDNQEAFTVEELITLADKNLYRAKKQGKNQIVSS